MQDVRCETKTKVGAAPHRAPAPEVAHGPCCAAPPPCLASRSCPPLPPRPARIALLQDNVFVDVVVSVQYQVIRESLYDAFYKLTVGGRPGAPGDRARSSSHA